MRPDLRPWGRPEPEHAQRATDGENNEVWLLAARGEALVWRACSNLGVDQLEREHELLTWIDRSPFAIPVPLPLPTRDGRTYAVLPDGRPTVLARRMPGRPARRDGVEIPLAATAYADLLTVLADAPHRVAPHDWRHTTMTTLDPDVPDIDGLAHDLRRHGAKVDDLAWLRGMPAREQVLRSRLAALPTQVIHADPASSNLLVDHGAVTAVLDFEISGVDLRINDLAAALPLCAGDPWEPAGQEQIRLFGTTYAERAGLTAAELAVLPDLVALRGANSVVWWSGRWRRGFATASEVVGHLHGARVRDAHRSGYAIA